MATRDGVKAVQYTLRAMGSSISADGIVGPQTRAAVSSLSGQDRALVEELQKRVVVPKTRSGALFVSYATARRAVELAMQTTRAPGSYLAYILPVENREVTGGYETTSSGTFRGLGQFNQQTWDGLIRLGYDLPVFERGSVDPVAAMKAVGYLYKENQKSYNAVFPGRKFTDEIAYLHHNQGAPAARRFLQTGSLVYPKQSKHALTVVASARSQHEKENRA